MEEAPLLSPVGPLSAEQLVAEVKKTLQETIFTSSLRTSPRRMTQISEEMASSFFQFLESENERAVSLYGQKLVEDGVSPHTILAMAETLRRLSWESPAAGRLMPLSGKYVNALLEGYIATREAHVLQQQDQIRRAFERAYDRSKK